MNLEALLLKDFYLEYYAVYMYMYNVYTWCLQGPEKK